MKLLSLVRWYFELQKNLEKTTQELLWAKVWEDTKRGITWLDDLSSISPGRWAVGYNYIYVMTRVLEEIKPNSVLDLGLGISSTLISCYFNHRDNGIHTIIEQDREWSQFYTNNHMLSKFSKIYNLDCIKKEYKGSIINTYCGFDELLRNMGKKYTVISIDAPWGSDRYSRRDIVPLIPNILEDEFVIVIDDTNRIGEKDTVEEIQDTLTRQNIGFAIGNYSGECDCTVICSQKYSFLCSL